MFGILSKFEALFDTYILNIGIIFKHILATRIKDIYQFIHGASYLYKYIYFRI